MADTESGGPKSSPKRLKNERTSRVIAHEPLERALAGQLREARIDHAAFETRLRPCELSVCRAACCHDGVVLEPGEEAGIDRLLSDGALRRYGFNAELEGSWKAGAEGGRQKTATRPAREFELAGDFPIHFAKTRCVFLDDGHRCLLQRFSMDEGRHEWFLKPVGCWMHPIALLAADSGHDRPLLTIRTHANSIGPMTEFASCTHCGRLDDEGVPAYQALFRELAALSLISGRDFFGELSAPPLDDGC